MKKIRKGSRYVFDGKGALALVAGFIGGTSVIAMVDVISIFLFHINLQYGDFFLVLSNCAGFLGAIFAFDYLICRPSTGKKLNFNFGTTNLLTYFLIFPLMLGMMFISEFVSAQIPITGPFFGEYYDYFTDLMKQISTDPATLILLAVILAPLFEEIIFRGIILKGLLNKGLKPLSAITISSALFGIVHGNPWQFVGAILLGSVLGLVYYKTKSLLLPILLHAFNNLCSSILILYFKTESFADTFKVPEYILFISGILLFGTFYILFTKKYRVHYNEN